MNGPDEKKKKEVSCDVPWKQTQSIDQRPLRFSYSSMSNPVFFLDEPTMCRIFQSRLVPLLEAELEMRWGPTRAPTMTASRGILSLFFFFFFLWLFDSPLKSSEASRVKKSAHTKKETDREKTGQSALEHTRPLAFAFCLVPRDLKFNRAEQVE